MRWILAAVILLPGLAGCADDASTAEDPTFDDFEAEVADGKGLIRGIVVDTTITPIEGATVEIKASGLSAETNADGAFQFADLEPGTYFLDVSKVGYDAVQAQALVEADVPKPDILRIQIQAAPGTEPRAITYTADGFVQCGIGTPLTLHTCPVLDDEDKSTVVVPAAGDRPAWVQAEMTWKSTQPAGEELYVIIAWCGESCSFDFGDRWAGVEGVHASPLIARSQGDNRTALQTGVSASPGGPANGTGVALEQPFTVYVTYFYNIDAPDEGWTFLEDGEYEA